MCILNAYHVPKAAATDLYPTMTPVNTFRLIFNTYFSAGLKMLPDTSYAFEDDQHIYSSTTPPISLRDGAGSAGIHASRAHSNRFGFPNSSVANPVAVCYNPRSGSARGSPRMYTTGRMRGHL